MLDGEQICAVISVTLFHIMYGLDVFFFSSSSEERLLLGQNMSLHLPAFKCVLLSI